MQQTSMRMQVFKLEPTLRQALKIKSLAVSDKERLSAWCQSVTWLTSAQ